MKKKIFILLVVIIVCAIGFQIFRGSPHTVLTSLKENNLLRKDPRELNYRVYFFGVIPAANASIDRGKDVFYQGKEALHFRALAKPVSLISNLYAVESKIDSFVDPKERHVLKYVETLSLPGEPDDVKEIIYDQQKHVMNTSDEERTILPNTQDPLSMIYFLRHQEFTVGQEFDLNVNTNQKNYRFLAKVDRKEAYNISGKEAQAWVLTIDIGRRDKSRRNRTQMTVWITDDEARIPFLFKISASGALIVARLVSTF